MIYLKKVPHGTNYIENFLFYSKMSGAGKSPEKLVRRWEKTGRSRLGKCKNPVKHMYKSWGRKREVNE
ncbi:MAG: hypothetical protein ACYC4H_04050 [Desulfocucumaceae bacterium]